MICTHCAQEADDVGQEVATHEDYAAMNRRGRRADPPAKYGHAACEGCDCHHGRLHPPPEDEPEASAALRDAFRRWRRW